MIARRGKSPRHARRSAASTTTPDSFLSSRYLFFGGKGGVGKTTAAAATALFLLDNTNQNESILLFSTDPAHSLSDSLNVEIGNEPVEVLRRYKSKLTAYEMDAALALERFRKAHGSVLAEIGQRGTLLDEADIDELLNLSLPGLDEVMALFELSELDRSGTYTRIVVDTAPSGHTSRLLKLPEVFTRMVFALDRMADKHRYIVAHFARRGGLIDEVDLFLSDLNERIKRVRNLLHDKIQTNFSLVAIPEAMSVEETKRYREVLLDQGVPVSSLIVNRVEHEHGDCTCCKGRVTSQKSYIKEIMRVFKDLKIHCVALQAHEVRGIKSLQKIGNLIWSSDRKEASSVRKKSSTRYEVKSPARSAGSFPLEPRRIFIFGGKGGVGKTTAASAFALSLARNDRTKKYLIFSTDPAHSLSDSFAERVGAEKRRIAGEINLDAMEIDPGEWFEDLKRRYRSWTDELFSSMSAGSRLEVKFEREAMRELVELTPPGIDEIAALSAISDLLDEDKYDTIILDTAPTGHLIRFLELPQVALSWVRTFIKLLLKYQHIVHATHVAEELVALSKSIKKVLVLLTDQSLCEFIGVAIPERMSLEETDDLLAALRRLKVPMRRLLINGVIPAEAASNCSFCDTRKKNQLSVLSEFQERFGSSVELFVAPQQPGEIRGAAKLRKHFSRWSSLNSKRQTRSTKTSIKVSTPLESAVRQKH